MPYLPPTPPPPSLTTPYIQLLTTYTHEDAAAAGLRKRTPDALPKPPIHFSALEVVRDHRLLLLTGPSGSGKTTFARWLCRWLCSGTAWGEEVVRNEGGDVREERWGGGVRAWYLGVDSVEGFERVVRDEVPRILGSAGGGGGEVLVVVDAVERAGGDGARLVEGLVSMFGACSSARLLVLGDGDACSAWHVPEDLTRRALLPLLLAQRRRAIGGLDGQKLLQKGIGSGRAAENPAVFSLALQANAVGEHAEEVLDEWLAVVTPSATKAEELEDYAYNIFKGIHSRRAPAFDSIPLLAQSAKVQELLAARHLARLPPDTAIELFTQAPSTWEPIIRSLLQRLNNSPSLKPLINGLIADETPNAQHGALLVSDLSIASTPPYRPLITSLLLSLISEAVHPLPLRVQAGYALARLGDPRDLHLLTTIPAGTFTIGCTTHPNSQPVHAVSLDAYKIAIHPVVNRDYLAFTHATARPWHSPDATAPQKRTVPATDLSWHDATAYCAWLTQQWRKSGTIQGNEQVRLPTEAEWESAARGPTSSSFTGPLPTPAPYPWGPHWTPTAANTASLPFNAPLPVGLFPHHPSPHGCLDMAGQVWEWCSTAWGTDPTGPAFGYPYCADDGREEAAAPEVRWVLRGGCFNSGRAKVGVGYRGSLEPGGWWRGNGFRVVVAGV